MHESVQLECPVEFIEITPLNPLISKCQIKVCYVGEEPNRNGSVITKEVAREMANSLPGSPLVGRYNEETQDFEEHNCGFELKDGKYVLKENTRPYGFVDLNAKCWFAKFLDDGENEREYLMTEGYLWTGQYPEVQRVIDKGNNQSMELDKKTLDGTWAKNDKDSPQIFIVNKAIISKLCLLGEDYEPCFEGASVSAPTIQFSLGDSFNEQVQLMMNEISKFLSKEEQKVPTRYPVVVGDDLWVALYSHVKDIDASYEIARVYDGEVVLAANDNKYMQLNFSLKEDGTVDFAEQLVALGDDYALEGEPQFSAADVENYAASLISKEKYVLDEIPEYVELLSKFNALTNDYNTLAADKAALVSQNEELLNFRQSVERKDKENMIKSFYMLSDEDKKDVMDNIDKYSIDEIEAKLSILCVRNKVNFSLAEEEEKKPTTYSFDDMSDDAVPAWIKSLRSTAKETN